MEELDDDGEDDEKDDDSADADVGEEVGVLGRAPIKRVRGVEELELDDGLRESIISDLSEYGRRCHTPCRPRTLPSRRQS